VAPRAGELLDATIAVENRPSASAVVGVEAVVRAAPDGNTLLICDTTLPVMPTLNASLPFDIFRDLETIASIASAPTTLVVRAGLPNRDLFGLPRFNGTDSQGACGHERDVAAAGGAGILCEGDRMEINHACAELPILGRGRRCILISSDTPHRIV
jgi:hypothetical protein